MADVRKLKRELDTDPLSRGYFAMSNQEVADSINAKNRNVNRERMTGMEILAAVETSALTGMNAAAQRAFWGLVGMYEVDPFDPNVVEVVKVVFGNGSQTLTNLAAARVKQVSRGQEQGIGFVKVGEVAEARRLP